MSKIRNIIGIGPKKLADWAEFLEDTGEAMLVADGFEEAFVGIVESFGLAPRACYDYDKCIQILMRPSDMEYEDAVEFFQLNVEGSYVGEHTPAFIKQAQV